MTSISLRRNSLFGSMLIAIVSAIVAQSVLLCLYHNAPNNRGDGFSVFAFLYVFLFAPLVENAVAIFFVEFLNLIAPARLSIFLISVVAGLIHIIGKGEVGHAIVYFAFSLLSFSIYTRYYLGAKEKVGATFAYLGSVAIHFASNVTVFIVLIIHALLF